jgi:hypothetical protein
MSKYTLPPGRFTRAVFPWAPLGDRNFFFRLLQRHLSLGCLYNNPSIKSSAGTRKSMSFLSYLDFDVDIRVSHLFLWIGPNKDV